MAITTSTTKPKAATKKVAENGPKYLATTAQQLADVDAQLKALHLEVVVPMREKRAGLRKLRAELKKKLREEGKATKAKSTATTKKTIGAKAIKEAKIATLSKPTPSEKKWSENRQVKQQVKTIVTKSRA